MKKLIVGLALGVALCTLPACENLGKSNPDYVQFSMNLQKGLLYAEAAKLGADKAAESAVDNGLLKPGSPDAIRIADALQSAQNALVLARTANNLGRPDTVQSQIALATTLVGQALILIPTTNSGVSL